MGVGQSQTSGGSLSLSAAYMASRNSFRAGYGRRAIVRSTISPFSLSTMTSKLSNPLAIHGPHPAQECGALIELKLGCIRTGTTRRARLSENRGDDFTPLDRPYQKCC